MNKNLKTGLIVGGIVVGLFVVVPLVIGLTTGGGFYRYGMGPGMMGGWGWFMSLFWLAIVGFIVWAAIAAIQGRDKGQHEFSAPAMSSLEILKERYARGEIKKEEFEEKRKGLMS